MLLRSSSSLSLRPAKPVPLEPDAGPGFCKPVRTPSSSSCVVCQGNRNSGVEKPKKNLIRVSKKSDAIIVEDRKSATNERKKEEGFRSLVGEKSSVRTRLVGNREGSEFGVGGGVHKCGGPGSGGGGGGTAGGGGGGDSNSTDVYYQKMLEANPGNPLLLRNYAKFLHEVRGELAKAEEYYERAILASPGDGEVLSLYAKLIWDTRKDVPRAEAYFDQAVKANPDDCYVLASYANFLWNSEEEEDAFDMQGEVEVPPSHKSPTAAAA
ncbi:hypothetical protein SUGI_1164240 [Cryptomeria japonica]|uniref:uncharacterized protein LOC131041389 n=1 Tax=Cryptomeria japonica TaxID=3369 RepID=UPI0024148FA7|nr:uncharacterized protein LOC131041389 [Cryptomeria japonica]GLJ54273.1 hypothetical protein SUGI_1164240 [Cryptomeria japonica]